MQENKILPVTFEQVNLARDEHPDPRRKSRPSTLCESGEVFSPIQRRGTEGSQRRGHPQRRLQALSLVGACPGRGAAPVSCARHRDGSETGLGAPDPLGQPPRAGRTADVQAGSLRLLSAPALTAHRVTAPAPGGWAPGLEYSVSATWRVHRADGLTDPWFTWEVFCPRQPQGGSSSVCPFPSNTNPVPCGRFPERA